MSEIYQSPREAVEFYPRGISPLRFSRAKNHSTAPFTAVTSTNAIIRKTRIDLCRGVFRVLDETEKRVTELQQRLG